MFDYIWGQVVEIDDESVVVEVSGLGYQLYISKATAKMLNLGNTVKLYTYLHVRENEIKLFGFYDKNERRVFRSLISVSGIGPKVALNILSKYTPTEILTFIATDDVKSMTSIPGVGKKTAQRIIVELKDRVDKEDLISSVSSFGEATSEVVQALMALGFNKSEIAKVVDKIEGLEIDDAIKMALKELSG
ncbi:Holliday junction branch migration protein RuvA [Caldanaerobius fijiensis]|nr:Holliday junction branch migration protein RuvA [Caldanaerobius fijiensis]